MSVIDLKDIQGNVFRGYRFDYATYVFLRVDNAPKARELLRHFLGHVTTSEDWGGTPPPSAVNIAFSYRGLEALGVPPESLYSFPEDFRQGMAARAETLGDKGLGSPEKWDGGLGSPDVHVMVGFNALTTDALKERCAWFQDLVTRLGALTVLSQQEAGLLDQGKEHFGFSDGFGQPSIEGSPNEPLPGQGVPVAGGGWRPLKVGEFVLGYEDEDGILPPAPIPGALGLNGTYLVYRKLQQHVTTFRNFLKAQAVGYPGGEEMLAAKIVGRWRDGTPVELSPDRPDPGIVKCETKNTDFRYAEDADGSRCPIGAHIRRTNPRDGAGATIHRHRIMRRGLPYGTALPEGAEDDGQERGVIFMCLNASISRQFEFIQQEWANDGNLFGLGTDKDVIIGNNDPADPSGKMTIQGKPPYFLHPLPRMVTVRGGEYFFMPGINALQWLADGDGFTR